MSKNPLTENEIIAYLERSSLPTLLVEGRDDAGVYRWIENQLGLFSGSVLICSGRDTLVSIYRKRHLFQHGKLAWLADLDMWKFSTPPLDLAGIVFTTGYSIENDLYAGSEIEKLMDEEERNIHSRLLDLLCRWFAFEVEEYQTNKQTVHATHIRQVLDLERIEISLEFATKRGYREPEPTLFSQICGDYKLSLRGKTLFELLMVILGGDRPAKYSYRSLFEVCLKLYPNNPFLERICREVRTELNGRE